MADGEVEGPRPFFRWVDGGQPAPWAVTWLTYDPTAEEEPLEVAAWETRGLALEEGSTEWLPPGAREAPVVAHDQVRGACSLRVGERVRRVRLAVEPGTGRKIAFGALVPLTVVLDLGLLPVYLVGGLVLLVTS